MTTKIIKEGVMCGTALLVSLLTFGIVVIHLVGGDPSELTRAIQTVSAAPMPEATP